MLTPTSSRPGPGRSRRRRWLSEAVTLLAAFAAVVGLSLQAPAASAGVASAAAAGHTAAAQAHAGRTAASGHHPAVRLRPVVRAAVRHDKSPPLRSLKPIKNLKTHKLKAIPLRSPPHMIGASSKAR